MINDMPLISVITPSLNQGKYIEDNIKSVMRQDYPNIEHIIVDGGSTDNTISILKKYENLYNLHWSSEHDRGQSDAVNKGFRLATGDIIGWINSDDAYFSRQSMRIAVNTFCKKKCDILYGDYAGIDGNNKVKRIYSAWPIFNYEILLNFNFIPQPSTFFRKKIIHEFKLDNCLRYTMDYDFWLRIGEKYHLYHTNNILSCFRVHNASKTIAESKQMWSERKMIEERYNKNQNKYLRRFLKIFLLLNKYNPNYLLYVISLNRGSDLVIDFDIPTRKDLLLDYLFFEDIKRLIFKKV